MKRLRRGRISIRLRGWDYRSTAWYFVTICTHDRRPFFGEIIAQTMHHSTIGAIAHQYWMEIPQHCPNVNLDAFVIMPNHLHGILAIQKPLTIPENPTPENPVRRDVQLNIPTESNIPTELNIPTDLNHVYDLSIAMSAISPKAGSLSVVLRSYKAAVSRWCRANGELSFAWQSRFYDRIIHTESALYRVRQYIKNNPAHWATDSHNCMSLDK